MNLETYEKEHLEALRPHLAECMVLLRSNGDFPLEQPCDLALYGSGARKTMKGGTGSGEVNSRFFINVEDGLKQAGFHLTTEAWLDSYDQICIEAKKEFTKEIKARAKAHHTQAVIEGMGAVMPQPEYSLMLYGKGEVCVYVLSRISGEGNDRRVTAGDILLSATEIRDIKACAEKYEKFLLVLNVGGPVDLSELDEVKNILILSQLGVETGAALADVILGKQNPSGRLTTTWADAGEYSRIGEFGDINETRYKEGVYVGYRYFDSVGKKARFPFGFGLSYTTFEQKVTGTELSADTFTAAVEVKNTGTTAGKEVIQLYLSSPSGKLDMPYQQLAAFTKTDLLQPGEKQEVTVSFRLRDFAAYDTGNASYVLEKGKYLLRIGSDSVNTEVCAVITSVEDIVTKKVKNCCGQPDFEDWKPEHITTNADGTSKEKTENNRTAADSSSTGDMNACREEHTSVEYYEIHASEIETTVTDYTENSEIDPLIHGLSDEQLATVNVGSYASGAVQSIIGSASSTVAGAAGETTGFLTDQGFPVMVMADGPAGLRLSRDYFRDSKGVHTIGPAFPETIMDYMSPAAAWIMRRLGTKPKKGQKIEHHYMTMIPIGTAIAQSFNTEFAELCGDIVGAEMERTGVNLWLAPALNIHRDIRCGRNFEYYSEDPLVSGLFAAAVTNGVQQHPGCGTTIKHFAVNNQETNRYGSNSQVSERALREIYLRGFEICVRESQPKAVMTSYNLLNGTHTAERRDLTEDILRHEFGFQGIVMTDWTIAGMAKPKDAVHPNVQAGKVAAAGGDLVMPGSKSDVEDILKKMKGGSLTRKQLEINATRVYRMAKKLVRAV